MKHRTIGTFEKYKPGFPWLVVLLFCVYNLAYVLSIEHPVLVGDSWRYVKKFLIPFYDGSLSLANFWSDHHPTPITAVAFILNASIFDLNMKLELVIGILARIMTAGFLILYFYRISANKSRISLLGMGLAFCLIYPMTMYHWSVLAFVNVFTLIVITYFVLLDYSLRSDKPRAKDFIGLCLFAMVMIAVARDIAYLAIVSAILLLLVVYFLTRNKQYLLQAIWQAVIVLIGRFIYQLAGIGETEIIPNYLEVMLSNIPNIANTFVLSMLSGAIPLDQSNDVLGTAMTLVIAYFIVAIAMVLMILYIKRGLWRRSSMPVILMFYVAVFCLVTILYRYLPETSLAVWGRVPRRYLPIYGLGIIGFWWLFFEINNRKPWKIAGMTLLIAQASMFFGNELAAWKLVPVINADYERMSLQVYKQGMNEIPRSPLRIYGKGKLPKDPRLDLLRDRSLNVFSEGLMTESIREHKMKNR